MINDNWKSGNFTTHKYTKPNPEPICDDDTDDIDMKTFDFYTAYAENDAFKLDET